MGNLLVCQAQDHQANELKDASLSLPLIETERRAAIGARRKETPLPGSCEKRRLEQRGDGRSPMDPDWIRRHSEPSVLSQERDESRDVRLFPQGHVAIKQGLDLGVRLRYQGLASLAERLQRTSSALQGTVDGGNGEAEPLGHFSSGPLQCLAQEQHGPLGWRQVLEGCQEGQTDPFAPLGAVLRIAVRIGEQFIWEWLQPDRLAQPRRQGVCGVA